MKFYNVMIEYMDGVRTEVQATEVFTDDGQLHLYLKNGSMAPREHVGSHPLVNIRTWIRQER